MTEVHISKKKMVEIIRGKKNTTNKIPCHKDAIF